MLNTTIRTYTHTTIKMLLSLLFADLCICVVNNYRYVVNITRITSKCEIDGDENTCQPKPNRTEKNTQFNMMIQRVYKKTSPNSVLTLYLGTRDIIARGGKLEPLRGVVFVDPNYVADHKIFGQLTLTFRYGPIHHIL